MAKAKRKKAGKAQAPAAAKTDQAVGKLVLFISPSEAVRRGKDEVEPVPAIVVKVDDDRFANLHVFHNSSMPHFIERVPHADVVEGDLDYWREK